jgi:uncharacterized membrane protein
MNDNHPFHQAYRTVFGGRRNLSTGERVGSVAFGLAMAASGLKRADGWGALLGLAGMALTARGMSGHCPVKAATGAVEAAAGDRHELEHHHAHRMGALAE